MPKRPFASFFSVRGIFFFFCPVRGAQSTIPLFGKIPKFVVQKQQQYYSCEWGIE